MKNLKIEDVKKILGQKAYIVSNRYNFDCHSCGKKATENKFHFFYNPNGKLTCKCFSCCNHMSDFDNQFIKKKENKPNKLEQDILKHKRTLLTFIIDFSLIYDIIICNIKKKNLLNFSIVIDKFKRIPS